jgi:hypothetical protein
MRKKVPVIMGALLGIAHFALVGIPFILSKGGGESIAYQIYFLDFPLYIAAEAIFQRLLLSSVLFNFLWFVVLGTALYGLLGFIIGLVFSRGFHRTTE